LRKPKGATVGSPLAGASPSASKLAAYGERPESGWAAVSRLANARLTSASILRFITSRFLQSLLALFIVITATVRQREATRILALCRWID
jgi:hypothetical protein